MEVEESEALVASMVSVWCASGVSCFEISIFLLATRVIVIEDTSTCSL